MYYFSTSLRNWLYDSRLFVPYHAPLPVLSVGNISVGGSGKSPFTSFLAAELVKRGYQPAILLRGYKGEVKGPHLVTSADSPAEVGDEAVMHYTYFDGNVPVIVSAKRARGAELIAEKKLATVILLDDGFQHRALHRDLDLVLFDSGDTLLLQSLREDQVLPRGSLRERARGLNRAHCFIAVRTSGRTDMTDALSSLIKHPILSFEFKATDFLDIHGGERQGIDWVRGRKISLLTSIAKPERVSAFLSSMGGKIGQMWSFEDHHLYDPKEVQGILGESSVPIITTAKDAVKLANFVQEPGRVFCIEREGSFSSPENERSFWKLVETKIAQRGVDARQ